MKQSSITLREENKKIILALGLWILSMLLGHWGMIKFTSDRNLIAASLTLSAMVALIFIIGKWAYELLCEQLPQWNRGYSKALLQMPEDKFQLGGYIIMFHALCRMAFRHLDIEFPAILISPIVVLAYLMMHDITLKQMALNKQGLRSIMVSIAYTFFALSMELRE